MITIDLDKYEETKKTFSSLGLSENKDFLIIGKNETGKKCIEGLVPNELYAKVSQDNIELLRESLENSEYGKNARNKLKAKILEAFKSEDKKGNLSIYSDFYKLSEQINKVFKKK